MISGTTTLIAHLGHPTEGFVAPRIYNPWFEEAGIDAAVVPMGVRPDDYAAVLKALFMLTNVHGALVTMPHKVSTVALLDDVSPAVRVAGACNAIVRLPDGSLFGDLFDGEGFVRGLARKGFVFEGASCLVVGAGGVGAAIAASLAGRGVAAITLFDVRAGIAEALAARLTLHLPRTRIGAGSSDPAGHDLVVNATPLGMRPGDPLPFDLWRVARTSFVADVVMAGEITPLTAAARERGCRTQAGIDMLFEQIPAYLEFFGFGTATPGELRAAARLAD